MAYVSALYFALTLRSGTAVPKEAAKVQVLARTGKKIGEKGAPARENGEKR
jgi:hypothetical protein